jgi:hypothetical protein
MFKPTNRTEYELWLGRGDNRAKAVNYIATHTPFDVNRVATDPFPKYHWKRRVLTVWLFVLNDKGERVFNARTGASKIKTTVKVAVPPPWVQ